MNFAESGRNTGRCCLLVVIVVLALIAGCGTESLDRAQAPRLPRYSPPADGSGYGQPIDQPMPLPSTSLIDGCAWIKDALPALAPLNLRFANGTPSGCQFGAGDASQGIIQARLSGPYDPIGDPTKMLEPTQVAGIPGRLFVYASNDDPSFCSITLDVRAYSALTVDAFNHKDAPSSKDNTANCELATKSAEILVRRYVPLAGGTPFAATQQRPTDVTLRHLKPCTFIVNPIFTPVIKDDPKPETTKYGTTCTYQDQHGSLRELITTGTGGLDNLPKQLPGSHVANITFGDYPVARREQNDRGCVIAIETGGGQALAAAYTNSGPTNEACQIANTKLADSIIKQIR